MPHLSRPAAGRTPVAGEFAKDLRARLMLKCRFLLLWNYLLLLVWASWWGGLSFYAIAVVPIATEQIGSTSQGFITREVTQWHNVLFAVVLALLLAEAIRRRSVSLGGLFGILFGVGVGLFLDHSYLSKQMDPNQRTVPEGFYADHAVYLWLTAIEWFLGILVLGWLVPVQSNRNEIKSSFAAEKTT